MIGQTISHYRILEKLGEGGMGVVYKAQDTRLDRTVALKFLPPHLLASDQDKARFIQEAKAESVLDHPNICTVHEIDESMQGQLFIVMSYYEGETLKKKIERGHLKIEEATDIAIQVAQGLARAHKYGIVHRDIKPANIIITNDGVAKIVDFGLAKLADQAVITKTGTTIGTVAYMSPEQARGDKIDHRTDIWSLGLVLYEMITGQRPFKSEYEQGIIYLILKEEARPLSSFRSDVPQELEYVIKRALEKDPDDRYHSVEDFIDDIRRIVKYSSDKHPGSYPAPKRIHRKFVHRFGFIAGTILLVTFVVIGFVFIPWLFKSEVPLEKSIAVLPFINDSPDEENEYFINGIMEEILINLQAISDLRVISRTSVEQYRGNTKSATPQIARRLGVNYIVVGSGQKYGNTFRLRVQLIAAAQEKNLWSSSYEQEINDVREFFLIQNQIAQTIAEELKVVITPQERNLIFEIPTENIIAYNYYLKGKQLRARGQQSQAIDFYSKAIEQDPLFLLAYLSRAEIYAVHYYTKSGNREGEDRLAKADLEKAMQLNPDHPEVRLQKVNQLYRFDHDYDTALEILNEMEIQMTNNPTFFVLRGALLRRKGRWEESLANFLRASRLDPLFGWHYLTAGEGYRLMRKYPEAVDCFKTLHFIFGHDSEYRAAQYELFNTVLFWKGDLPEALNTAELAMADLELPYLYSYFYYTKQFKNMIPLARKFDNHKMYRPRIFNLALIYYFDNNFSLCGEYADSTIADLMLKIDDSPDDERYYATLGYVYAFKGDRDKAIDNAKTAIKLKPLKSDAWFGYHRELDLANIYVLTGEYELAMDKIEYLLTIPGDFSVPLLRIDPLYDKLRDIPRFQEILTTEYKTNY
jgi:eukaryotic-like serine/threonine-protein kinase